MTIDYDALFYHAASLAERFRSAEPFPWLAIDGFVEPEFLRSCLDSLKLSGDDPRWKQHQKGKRALNDVLSLKNPLGKLAAEFNSARFVEWLEAVSGIPGLVADNSFAGAGLHQVGRGGRLGIHVDFNRHANGLYRRLNCFLYLNTDWPDEWGGHLELWDQPGGSAVQRIAPAFNRFVMFESSEVSWHGHPQPLKCPENRARLSLAAYYYTSDAPPWFHAEHSTVYVPKKRK